MKNIYRQAMENLEKQYLETWKKADEEKKQTGKVSKATERILIQIENEMEMLNEAF